MTYALHRPLYTADILVNALSTATDRPMLHLLGGPTLTAGEVRDETSRMIQALASLGVGKGTRVGLISPNRPEVLHASHAVQLLAAVYVPMHPLSGLADHLHVIRDSGVEVLIFDADRFAGRAKEIGTEMPGLKLKAFGDCAIADNLTTLAATFTPRPLVAPEVGTSIMQLMR